MTTYVIGFFLFLLGYWIGRHGGWNRCARRYGQILREKDQHFNAVLGDRDRRNMALQYALERLAGIKTYTFPGNIATPGVVEAAERAIAKQQQASQPPPEDGPFPNNRTQPLE